MQVLMITGDKHIFISGSEAHSRFLLQQAEVAKLEAVYWGRGALWPKVSAGHYDVVTAQDPFWRGLFAWRASRRIGATLNVQVHTNLNAYGWFKRALATYVLRKAHSVRVVSEKIKKQVQALGVMAPIHVLPVYIDTSRFKNLAREPHASKNILWIGRFEGEKDPLLAVAVYKEVLQHVPDATMSMLGKGSLEHEVKKFAQSLALAIEFPGWQDTAAYLPRADVVLSTSKHESWGASIVEALAAGVAVVAPDVGIAREAGAIVVPRTALAKAVVEALHSNARGALALPLLESEAWARAWITTLQ